MSPTVRKRTVCVSTVSPSRGGVRSRHRHQQAVARHDLALVREVDASAAPASRARCTARRRARSSCEIGNTRMCSPGWTRALYRSHSSGRWFFGSHWPNSSRKRKDALLGARLLLVAARAADAGVELELGDGIEQRHRLVPRCASRSSGCAGARVPRRIESSTERTIRRSPSSAHALSRKAITSAKLWPVSMCSSGNGKRPGRNAFSARRSRTTESLPPENSSAGLAALGRDLAQDVDRLGLEPVEVARRRLSTAVRTVVRSCCVQWMVYAIWRSCRSVSMRIELAVDRRAGRIPSAPGSPTTSARRARPRPAVPRACTARSRSTDSRGRAAAL